ncbi:hypothetical protein [Halobacillus litoralis]|uniref:hypothetical protein n=1 Tax=Halobacillus litoralis TaxID=45668 RepID=UPI0013E8DA76|nr:hypothetical protein [Halobacillus litoralis]
MSNKKDFKGQGHFNESDSVDPLRSRGTETIQKDKFNESGNRTEGKKSGDK